MGSLRPNDPPVSKTTIIVTGSLVYILASTWPPLILFLTFLLSQFIPYAYYINDTAIARRRYWVAFEEKTEEHPEKWRDLRNNVDLKERYWVNQRGMCLMTSTMVPKDGNVKAVVCFCHGYTDNASYMKRAEFQRYVDHGIAVVTIEYEGHGRSDGTIALVSNWKLLVDDVSSFFEEETTRKFPGVKYFLVGESMGGAVAYYTYRRNPSHWSGVIFISPMCKVADEMLPPQWIVDGFKKICGEIGSESFFGTLPVAPSADLPELAFKVKEKKDLVYKVPTFFGRKPRLATARELLNVTNEISETVHDFDAPFLIQHGKDDRITCPKLSQLFYDEAKSKDKELKLYDGMWHTITSGEPDENIDLVFNDAISWVKERI